MPDDTNALKQVNRSGFPFQLKVEHDIRATEQRHKWSVASREHPWTSPEGNSGFIDIVLKSSAACLVIECKRVRADDASQLQWLFLVEEAKSDLTGKASSFYVEAALDVRGWDDVRMSPYSLESQFCVLQGDEPRKSLLENLAKGLLQSTEGLAQEEISVYQSIKASRQHGFRLGESSESSDAPLQVRFFLFPVIVTNAKIAVCRFDPRRVKIEQGTLEQKDAKTFEVPFIRFRKSLVTGFPGGVFNELADTNRARERTVLVVNAIHLVDLLSDWKIESI